MAKGKMVSNNTQDKSDPNKLVATKQTPRTQAPRVSGGDPAADMTKTSGIKMRGTGAATKGKMARGPMG